MFKSLQGSQAVGVVKSVIKSYLLGRGGWGS